MFLGGCVPTMARMAPSGDESISRFEHALADEILAEVARQRLTARSVQTEARVKPRAWSNYLTARVRHIPMTVVADICAALNVRTSEMLRRAEVRAAELDSHEAAAERALGQLAPDLAERVRRVDREQRDAQEDDSRLTDQPTGVGRSAMTLR